MIFSALFTNFRKTNIPTSMQRQHVKYTISIILFVCQSTTASVLIGFARVLKLKQDKNRKKTQKFEDDSISEDMNRVPVRRFYLSYLFKYIIDLNLIKCQYFILTLCNFINCFTLTNKLLGRKQIQKILGQLNLLNVIT